MKKLVTINSAKYKGESEIVRQPRENIDWY